MLGAVGFSQTITQQQRLTLCEVIPLPAQTGMKWSSSEVHPELDGAAGAEGGCDGHAHVHQGCDGPFPKSYLHLVQNTLRTSSI